MLHPRRSSLWALPLILACDPGPGPTPVAPEEEPPRVVEQVPGGLFVAEPCADLYDPDVVPVFELDIQPEDWAAIEADYAAGRKEYHPAVFRYGDEVVEDAQVRLKGNPSFSWFTEKMQFVIAFNEVNPDGRFHGQRKLALDASWYEPTFLRDRVAWSIIRRQDVVPGACANSAQLVINGELYGLYTNIEFLDREWLERVFGDHHATGTLWKYGYDAVSNAEAALGLNDDFLGAYSPDELAALGEVEEWLAAWALEIVVGSDDGYWCCNHNFYLYEHPARGLLFVPWDLDGSFDLQGYTTDPIEGYPNNLGLFEQRQFLRLVEDPVWGPKFLDALEDANTLMDPEIVLGEIDAWQAQLLPLIEADPTRSTGVKEHVETVERMRAWVPARHEFLKSWIACARGEDTDADGDGATVCVDPHDGDPAIHPAAAEVCDGVDNDADGWVDDHPDCEDCQTHELDGEVFLFCRWPRDNDAAQDNCAESGGALSGPQGAEATLYFFYTWPVQEHWWISGGSGGRCGTWNERSFTTSSDDCDIEHPSVCRL